MLVLYGTATVIVGAVAGTFALLVGRRHPFLVVSTLVLLVPFRDFATRWMFVRTDLTIEQVTAVGRWWFVVIAAMLVLVSARWVVRVRRRRERLRLDWVDALAGLALLIGAVQTLVSPSLPAAFTSFRGYVQPFGVYILARALRPGRNELRTFLMLWLLAGIIIAGLAIYQAVAWTEQDYREQGYVRQDGDLVVPYAWIGGEPFLRPASTVSGPNELGLDLLLMALLAVTWSLNARGFWRIPLAGFSLLFVAGMALSYSRSAALGFVVALGGLALLSAGRVMSFFRSMDTRTKLRAVLVGAGVLTAAAIIFAATGLAKYMGETLGALPGAYHILDSSNAIGYLIRHPQGVGMGLVEPKGALALIESGGTYHVEGSIFQIGMEMGVWGLGAWLAFWGAALARIYRNWHRLQTPELRVVAGSAFAGWLGSLVAFLFLPLMQSISLMVWLWFLLGAGYQSDRFEADWNASEQPAAVP